MNILHISSNYYPEIGGPASSVPYLAGELIKRGHRSCVLTKDAAGYPSFEIVNEIPVYRSARIPGNFYNPAVATAKSVAMGLKARKVIEKEKIDMIHSHDINVSAIAGIIGTKFKSVKKVVKLSGSLSWEFLALNRWKDKGPQEFFENPDFLTNVLEKIQNAIGNGYDAIIAPSKYMKEYLIKYTGIESYKIHVVYNGISVHQYPEEYIRELRTKLLGKNKYLVVSACRMLPWKGIEYLIEAFKNLPKEIRLILIGDGPLRKNLESQARGLNVEFLNKVPHNDIQAYIRAADVYVLPSIYEPSALALLDCLAVQTPIIATEIGGTPEMIQDNKTGLLIEDRNPQAICRAIERSLSDSKLRENIKENQKTEYEKYRWENIIKEYLDVYGKVLNEEI